METIVVGPFQVNCFVVWDDDKLALVIDPGDEDAAIDAVLETHGLTVAAYLLTHGHMDHVSALAALHERRPAPIALHPADARWAFTETNAMPPYYGIPRRPPRIERELADGQTWTDGQLAYRVLSTPGHTPGGVCLWFENEGRLFAGDTLFRGSVGRTDFPGGSTRQLKESLARLAKLPPHTIVHAGHGPDTTIGQEKRTNFFMREP